MNIRINAEPPNIPNDWSKVTEAFDQLVVGQWMALEDLNHDDVSRIRAVLNRQKDKGGSDYRTTTDRNGDMYTLYIQKV